MYYIYCLYLPQGKRRTTTTTAPNGRHCNGRSQPAAKVDMQQTYTRTLKHHLAAVEKSFGINFENSKFPFSSAANERESRSRGAIEVRYLSNQRK